MKLAVADVERDHPRSAGLEEAIREPAGRGADVEAVFAADVDGEGGEGRRQLLAAAGDETRSLRDLQLGVVGDLLAGLRVPLYAAGQDERLGLRAALGQPALDEQHVQTLLRTHGGERTP